MIIYHSQEFSPGEKFHQFGHVLLQFFSSVLMITYSILQHYIIGENKCISTIIKVFLDKKSPTKFFSFTVSGELFAHRG